MMYYFFMALFCGVIGFSPLLLVKKFKTYIGLAVLSTLPTMFLFWFNIASTIGPYFGDCFWAIAIFIIISIAVDSLPNEKMRLWYVWFVFLLPIGLWILLESPIFRSQDYANLIGPIEEKVWTQDVQPKDPKHFKYTSFENAVYRAKNSLTLNGKNLGSQYNILESGITLQKIKGEFWYVAPIDFRGEYGIWSSAKTVPSYFLISADNDEAQPDIKDLSEEKKFRYTPGAYFSYNLERHIRLNGYLGMGLTDYSLEIDDEGNAWWVVTTYKPSIWNSGDKVLGVLVVDPANGDIKEYKLGDKDFPVWIDRVMPAKIVKQYLDYMGHYKNGFMNLLPIFGGKTGLIEPESPNLIYGDDGNLDFVVGLTSRNNNDTSLVSIAYVNSRTGKTVFYKTNGGSIDSAIVSAVKNNQYVNFKKLHPTDLQTYNLYGTMVSYMPLLNDSHARQGVALVNVMNIEQVAVGADLAEALNAYQKMISNKTKASIEKSGELKSITRIVDRIHTENKEGGMIFRIYFKGIPHLFVGDKVVSRALTVTEPGDNVTIEYYDSETEEIPVFAFANHDVELIGTDAQKKLSDKTLSTIKGQLQKAETKSIKAKIDSLSPEELKQLEKSIPVKQ